ncbi:hypothetical protein BGY98DRAFT_1174966 [Russula aff. rugulosa BPL654]|nr:hypothetical protein BGY98DRAFT_1174966 [Russula aff. rugulosa BPL654]
MKASRTRSQATKGPRVSASYSEFQCKREATPTPSCSLMRRRRERDGWVTVYRGSFLEETVREGGNTVKVQGRVGRHWQGRSKNTFPQLDTGRSALLSHIGPICETPTARSYKAWAGHSKQAAGQVHSKLQTRTGGGNSTRQKSRAWLTSLSGFKFLKLY